MRELPRGTVTFLFTDVEGSTRLLQELGDSYADALAEHRRALRGAFLRHDGVEVDTQGDAFFVAFSRARDALAAAAAAQKALALGPIRVRMGVHTGEPVVTDEGYVGLDVHRAARIAAVGHGGQVLVSATTRELVDDPELLDLGEHRLKDLTAPERIYQLGTGVFPALRSLHRTNLPIAATPFVGRERELEEVRALIVEPSVRLLTLTGPGGVGKTRLALQAAGAAADAFPDGAWWIPLATLTDPSLVLEQVRLALGSDEEPVSYIGRKRLLCLLDNFEHLAAAAPALSGLLASCPNATLLVTSREALRIGPERRYPVNVLDPEAATELFIARAQAIDPAFEPAEEVGAVCSRLDGLPLAIELAAARVGLFSPAQLLERLEQSLDLLRGGADSDPRQLTLRATIEWSHDLLTTAERDLFARLAVFVGGCVYDDAETIAGADPDTLESLLDKSLLRRSHDPVPRYWMLATVGEYAREQLLELPDRASLERRHAEHFLALAELAEPELYGGDQERWAGALAAEHENIGAALRWTAANDEGLETRLAVAMGRFWVIRSHLDEGRRWLDRAVEHTTHDRGELRIRTLAAAGLLARVRNEWDRVRRLDEEALELARSLDDTRAAAMSLIGLASVAGFADANWELAQRHAREAERLADAMGNPRLVGAAQYNLADVALHLRRFADAIEHGRRAETILSRLGNKEMTSLTLAVIGLASLECGSATDAAHALERGFLMATELGFAEVEAATLEGIAALSLEHDPATSATLLGRADEVRHHERARVFVRDRHERTRQETAAVLGADVFTRLYEIGRSTDPPRAVEIALAAVRSVTPGLSES